MHEAEAALDDRLPANVHNLTLTADGTRVWSTLPLRAADISDPRHPKVLPRIEPQIAASGAQELAYAHEAWPSPDGKRLYIGNQGTPETEQLLVVDIRDWPRRPARAIGNVPVPGHSIRPMQIDGKPYLLASDESILNPTAKGCLPDRLTPFGGVARPRSSTSPTSSCRGCGAPWPSRSTIRSTARRRRSPV